MTSDEIYPLERVVTSAEECDLSQASYNEDLSAVDLEAGTAQFYATLDKLVFKPLIDVITTVLEANRYALNLENLLACLDQLQLGLRVRLTPKSVQQGTPQAKGYMPAMQFHLPSKNRIGPLLKRFYDEIQSYEAEIARLRENQSQIKYKGKWKTNEELLSELEQLEQDKETLKAELDGLARKIAQMERSHAEVSRALVAQNLLPSNVRLTSVQNVDLSDRRVLLKSGRTSYDVPLAFFITLPQKDQQCLVSIRDGHVVGVFLYEETGISPQVRLARVLYVEQDRCKVRDDSRRNWLVTAQNPLEKEIIYQLSRGDQILLFFHDEHLVRFQPCSESNAERFSERVQEAIIIKQALMHWDQVANDKKKRTAANGVP